MEDTAKHKADLKEACEKIGANISQQIDKDNPQEVAGKIQELTCWLGSIPHYKALAQMIYNQKITDLTQDTKFNTFNSTEKKMIFAGMAKNEFYYVTTLDELGRGIVHAIDGLRSIISFLKAELQNLPTN